MAANHVVNDIPACMLLIAVVNIISHLVFTACIDKAIIFFAFAICLSFA